MLVNQIEKLRKAKTSQRLSYEEMAFGIGVHSMSVYRWLKKGIPPKSRAVRRAIDQFLREIGNAEQERQPGEQKRVPPAKAARR